MGGKRTYQNLTIGYFYYRSVGAKNVFAIRGSACMVTTAAPFYDLCLLGMSKDLRGYQAGQFRDNRMLVGRAEYRRDLFWRVGAVAFAGAGAVALRGPGLEVRILSRGVGSDYGLCWPSGTISIYGWTLRGAKFPGHVRQCWGGVLNLLITAGPAMNIARQPRRFGSFRRTQ